MLRWLSFAYRLSAGLLLGAQLFFAAVAAQDVFPREVAALPQGHPLRTGAAETIGRMLGTLDQLTLGFCALAVLVALRLGSRRAVIPPLAAGVLAGISAGLVTPAIHQLRMAGQTSGSTFGMLHGLSTLLLLA